MCLKVIEVLYLIFSLSGKEKKGKESVRGMGGFINAFLGSQV